MTESTIIADVIVELRKRGLLPEQTPHSTNYEKEYRNRLINKLCNNIRDKRVHIKCIADWTGKTETYIKKNIPTRNRYTSTFYAVDVIKFLCDLWSMDYPETFLEYQKTIAA